MKRVTHLLSHQRLADGRRNAGGIFIPARETEVSFANFGTSRQSRCREKWISMTALIAMLYSGYYHFHIKQVIIQNTYELFYSRRE